MPFFIGVMRSRFTRKVLSQRSSTRPTLPRSNDKPETSQALFSGSNASTSICSLPNMVWKRFIYHYHHHNYRWNEKHAIAQAFTSNSCHSPIARSFSHVKRNYSQSGNLQGLSLIPANARKNPVKLIREKISTNHGIGDPISKMARAVSLACSRSHLAPQLFAGVIGSFAWAHAGCANAEELNNNCSMCNNSHDRPAFSAYVWLFLEGLILSIRMIYLLILFSPAAMTAPIALTLEGRCRELWLKLVHKTLEKAGAAFIKWGQWAATRPDLFPRDLCSELSKLHSQAPAHNFSYTRKTIEKAFGRNINEIFEYFEEDPVASGSIAQVHKASLRIQYSGRKTKSTTVAVKVRHPGVSEVIRRDFVLMNLIAKVTSCLPALKWLRLEDSVQQFAVFMLTQVDLAREAAQLNRFLYNFRRWKDVSFPKPLYPLVHPAVLVETYEQGESVARYVDQPESDNRLNRSLAHIGTHTLLKMLLVDNFIHADMHPGNILVRVAKDNLSSKRLFRSKPHVIFLDVGMTAELSSNDRVNLLEFFKAVAIRDGRAAAECTLKFSRNQSCPDRDSFIREVEESFKFWGSPEGEMVHPAECMQHLLDQVRRYKVNIDGNVCTVMVTTLVLQGWQRKLDPDYNIMDTLQKLLFKVDWANSLSYTIEGLMAP
eukprot:TRINITY_DN17416_c0_g1_i6.p1 TRINITY_DN17416_c0_g1~~TRINITY_DN17416_c0_g1_i6.p1  ORF type:complete len:657 (-),score=88.26 TRINITY_DN17416_c0_g1_i6:81-2051(-)